MAWQKDISVGSFTGKLRMIVDVVSQNRAANTSVIRVRLYGYNSGSGRSYNLGNGAAVSVSGSASRSDRATFNIPGRSWGQFVSWQWTLPHDSAGNLSFSLTGRVYDTGTSMFGNGGSITISGSAPRLVLAPTAPSWGSTVYASDTSIRIAWTNRSTARGPYDRIEVQGWSASTGKWWSKATLSGSATSWTESGVTGNDEVRYRVRARGPGGTSAWVQGGTLGTRPAAPSNVTATKSGLAIRVSWKDNAAPTNRTRRFTINDNPGGNGWVDVGEVGGSATSWTHSDADPAVTHQYRVWAHIVSGGRDLASTSASGSSNVVQLQAAPKQPGRQEPKDAVTQIVGEPITFQWSHNPVDTTDQTAAQLQWRIDGGAWTTVDVTGPSRTTTLIPDTGGAARATLEWRVRTKGDHPDWSPWSTTNGPQLSTPPTVTVQYPVAHEPLETSRVEVSWSYDPNGPEPQLGQSAYRVDLVRDGDVVEQQTGSTAEAVALESRLSNDTEYTVRVQARNGDSLWSEVDESTFTTDFPLPAPVTVFPEWDREGATVAVEFEENTGGEFVAPDAIDVERRDEGGDWVLIASGIPASTTITDRTPRIGTVEYRAISRTVLPTETVGPVAVAPWPFPIEGAYVSGGAGFDRTCTAMGAAADDEPGIEQTTKQFAGVAKPVAFFGTARTHRLAFTGTIPLPPNETPVSTREEWVGLLHEYGVVCYRDPVGRKRFGLLTVSFSQEGPIEALSLEVEEVQWTESVRRVSDLELEGML